MSDIWNKTHGWKILGLSLALMTSPLAVRADDYSGGCASGSCAISFGAPVMGGSCGGFGSCPCFHCPKTHFCVEGPPCICVKQGCAKPVINPCDQPNWGYYQTCWSPWPGGPNWSHCPVQPPASLVFPPPGNRVPATLPGREPAEGNLPNPRMIDR